MRQLDVVPAKVGDRILTHVDDGETEHEGDREAGVDDDAPTRDRIGLREVRIEVVLIGIARQQREPRGVGLVDGATKGMLVDVAHDEVIEESAELGRMHGSHAGIIHQWDDEPQRGVVNV